MDKSVDNVDNYGFLHTEVLITSPDGTQIIPDKKVVQVGFCRLCGTVEWGSQGADYDKLCEKPPNSGSLPSFLWDVSISPFGKYCG